MPPLNHESASEPNHPSAKENDGLKRFRDRLKNYDDSQFETVSSIKKRWDLLHAMQDDDVIVITTRPKLERRDDFVPQRTKVLTIMVVVVSCLILILYELQKYKARRNHPQNEPNTKESVEEAAPSKGSSRPNPTSTLQPPQQSSEPSDSIPISTEMSVDSQINVGSQKTTMIVSCEANTTVAHPETPPSALDVILVKEEGVVTSLSLRSSSDLEKKVQVASQIVQDIKLFQKMLSQEGMDAALAPQLAGQLAGSLQLQQITDSQRELEVRRMCEVAHHRQLDRQLSDQQHVERLQAAKYDPNWKDKLNGKRDQCWNAVSRLLFEVGAAYHFAKLAQPLLRLYTADSMVSSQQLIQLVISSVRTVIR
jgi:hypothetical protein